VFIAAALREISNRKELSRLVLDRIRRELVITYKQTSENMHMDVFEGDYNYDDDLGKDVEQVTCSAVIFAEKLFTQRNLFGSIKQICKTFGSLELLEQYGNYMRLRVSREDKTIGQMFGMVD
jgi:hypothetical protein